MRMGPRLGMYVLLFLNMISFGHGQDKEVPDYIMKKLTANSNVEKLIESYGIKERGRNFESNAVTLQNEPCRPRLSVAEIPQPASVKSFYYPYYVQVYRCGGGCGHLQFVSRCRPKTIENVVAKVISITWSSGRPEDEIPPEVAYVKVQNHTSCECNCKHEGEVCNRFQYWDSTSCRCSCLNWGCPGNFTPHPNTCCACDVEKQNCEGRKKYWSHDHCGCICKNRDKPCKSVGKIRSPITCKCRCPPIICMSGTKLNSRTCICESSNL